MSAAVDLYDTKSTNARVHPCERNDRCVRMIALVVLPCQVVDSAGGWSTDGGVVSVMVVAV
jgi:hypothetical protein